MKKIQIFSNTTLKLIACVSMFCCHFGLMCFPSNLVLSILGRPAFPIFAFMIAEGCKYTKNRVRYFMIMFIEGFVMQLVYYFYLGDKSFNIFLIFCFAVLLIYLYDLVDYLGTNKKYVPFFITLIAWISILAVLYVICSKGNFLFTYVYANYGFFGMVTPLVIYIIRKKTDVKYHLDLVALCILFVIKCIVTPVYLVDSTVNNTWFMFLAIPLLLMYNGQRGKLKLKYFFYIFYPAHFVLIYLLSYLIH